MKRLRVVAKLAIIGILGGCAHYEPAPLRPADLSPPISTTTLPSKREDLLRLGIANDAAVAAARAHLRAAEDGRKAARNLPPLSLSLTTEYAKDADPSKPWLYGGALDIPLDMGAKRGARMTSADLNVLKARLALVDAIWGVRQRLRQAMSDLAMARQEVRIQDALSARRQEYRAIVDKRISHGEDAQSFAAQAQLDAATDAQGLLQAKSRILAAQLALARALNVSVASVQTLPPMEMPLAAVFQDDVAGLSEKSLYTRPDVLSAVTDYDLAENDLRLAVAAQYPNVTLSPGYTWERGIVKIPFGLNLSLPPLDGNRANIAQAQSARLAAGKALEDRIRTVQAEIGRAVEAVHNDSVIAKMHRIDDLPVSRDEAARAKRALAAGEIDRSEALAAEIAELQAELTVVQAEQVLADDRLKLEDAARQTLDDSEQQILGEEIKK